LLLSLTIKNFITAEYLDLDFSSGTTAITGETGSGKSLIFNALSILLGGRAETNMIRHDSTQAEISAYFDVQMIPSVEIWLQENGFSADKECLLRRVFNNQGRSKGYINGGPATMTQLQKLGEILVDIHDQNEHQFLFQRDNHRMLLDEYAKANDLLTEIKNIHAKWKTLKKQLSDISSVEKSTEDEINDVRFLLKELDQFDLTKERVKALEEEHAILSNTDEIITKINEAIYLSDDTRENSFRANLIKISSILDSLESKPRSVEVAIECFQNALIQIDEGLSELNSANANFDSDPKKLELVDQELKQLFQLGRKHKSNYLELEDVSEKLKEKLKILLDRDEIFAKVQKEIIECEQKYWEVDKILSDLRIKSSKEFETLINAQLKKLDMGYCSLKIQSLQRDVNQIHPKGSNTIEFLIRTNSEDNHKALRKIVSGGELSRISLAIQVVASDSTNIPTTLLDEVDVGVSGKTSDIIGRLLKSLGKRNQILCITHQAQVAVHAQQHLKVSRFGGSNSFKSEFKFLTKNERVEEIARILGGAKVTENTRIHASELISLAND
tara:strand:- start:263 stop:1936 length:1674 start_codon:yes stop_codon:yes gene_type:complete